MDHFGGTKNSGDSLDNQQWQWKSWDLPSKAYFVFALQPNATINSGVYPGAPQECYEAEDRWANKYAKFPLCPGAKLGMKTSVTEGSRGSFYFRTKNVLCTFSHRKSVALATYFICFCVCILTECFYSIGKSQTFTF